MRFTKYHGAGNDFVVVDARALDLRWADFARDVCHRRYGVGSDGLILVVKGRESALSMRMFNPDGSESEACGNGLRCFAKYAVDHGLTLNRRFPIDTLGGIREAEVFVGSDRYVHEVEVSMGAPRFAPRQIPVLVDAEPESILGLDLTVGDCVIPLSLVSMGNPHAVTFVKGDVDDYPLSIIGPAVEMHPIFPARVNFEVAQILNRGDIKARVWERGAGETLACGSGACAISVAAQRLGYSDSCVRVHLPGGTLNITWYGDDAEVRLRGPAVQVFVGEWPD